MHHHTEHRWTLVPLVGRIVPIDGWQGLSEPTTIRQARRWLAKGWRLGVRLDGLVAVTPIADDVAELADGILPKTVGRWGETLLYQAKVKPTPSHGLLKVQSSGVLALPDERVWAPGNAPDLERQLRHVQALAIVGRHPEHEAVAWRAISTHWPEDIVARLGGSGRAGPGEDPWRELRTLIGDSAGQLRSIIFGVGENVSDATRLVDAFRALASDLGQRELCVSDILRDHAGLPSAVALRAQLRDLLGVGASDELDAARVTRVLRARTGGRVAITRYVTGYSRWAVAAGAGGRLAA